MAASIQSLRSLVFTTYKRALKAGALTFAETEVHNIAHDGINYEIRYAPNLLKKPIPAASQTHNPSYSTPPNPTPKSNPFLPPNPALYVTAVPRSHYLVLNKFPVIPGHFILATTEFEKQGCPLTTGDLEAVLSVLRGWESDNNDQTGVHDEAGEHQCLYGFFNSGKESGASQPHRHLQFIPLTQPEMDGLWAKEIFDANPGECGIVEGKVGDLKVRYQSKVMYKHYLMKIHEGCKPEELWGMYSTLLSLAEYTLLHPTTPADAVLREVDKQWDSISTTQRPMDADVAFSYNMAFTKGWMGILPRTTETVYVVDQEEESGAVVDGVAIKCPGLNLNGTAMAGMALVRTRKEMDVVLADPGYIARTMGVIGVPQQEAHRASL
ncbi:bifunctional AP-4-A phosphorylase/ADP sulfurylase [Orbilia oligospora]|nr:bifunctional AP-4-A phosphorylase/ADP sulfurylase [Orbilia oligospora]KAF3238053.1 bifunctional AP-4-A phosphorylase/ADP sulfurylase [Orbilia oligospora]KAF3267298.1 bifunctional AP-4-A phosphorylase/ADP sulfurylase [Orbilia oligospora]KAF3294315.1 bifunctional AP-4-A phosphorylase/ADP sulfurylase [Orbilia oligospora]